MAEMEVGPQEEMANPQGMKVFAVERLELPEDLVSFPAVCQVVRADSRKSSILAHTDASISRPGRNG